MNNIFFVCVNAPVKNFRTNTFVSSLINKVELREMICCLASS